MNDEELYAYHEAGGCGRGGASDTAAFHRGAD